MVPVPSRPDACRKVGLASGVRRHVQDSYQGAYMSQRNRPLSFQVRSVSGDYLVGSDARVSSLGQRSPDHRLEHRYILRARGFVSRSARYPACRMVVQQ